MSLSVSSLGSRNRGDGVDCVPDFRVGGNGSTCELGESGSRIIDITVRVFQGVKGGPLVSSQRNAVLDAQRQVGLVSCKCQGSIDRRSMDEHSR